MRKSAACPALALALGAAAAALRMWQRSAGYDGSGLPVSGSVPGVTLAVFLAACAVLFLVLALRRPRKLADQGAALPCGERACLLLAAAGVLFLAGGVLNLLAVARGYLEASAAAYGSVQAQKQALRSFWFSNLMPAVLAAASVPACVALLVRAKRTREGPEEEPGAFGALMPPLFLWIWLIEAYRQHTANPILWDYVLLLFAVIALLLAGYDQAGFAFGVGRPRRSVFFALLALFFAVAALPDCGSLANAVTLAAAALLNGVELTALLRALEHAPAEPEAQT